MAEDRVLSFVATKTSRVDVRIGDDGASEAADIAVELEDGRVLTVTFGPGRDSWRARLSAWWFSGSS